MAVYIVQFLLNPLANSQTLVIEIAPGTSVRAIAAQLTTAGILTRPMPFILAELPPFNRPLLQAGEYQIPAGSSGMDLLQKLRLGWVIQHRLTIVEGWTFQQLAEVLNANPYLKHTLSYQDPVAVMAALGRPQASPEGLFFPDTYLFVKGTTDIAVLQRALMRMDKFMANAWPQRAPTLPYQNPYEALKAASLVEKESAYQAERPLIGGVIVLRLTKGMPLQMDPSVIYGLGAAYQGRLTHDDMRIDTPYNNYLYKGLPPTPIAFPSATAILAVLHPQVTDNLYFVAKGDGTHVFSATLKDQDKAIVQYQLKPQRVTDKPVAAATTSTTP